MQSTKTTSCLREFEHQSRKTQRCVIISGFQTCVVLRRCPAPSHPCCLAICAGGVPQTAVKFLCKRREEEITHKLSKFEKDRFGVRPGPLVWFVQVTHHVHSSLFNSALPGVQHQRAGKPVSLRGEGQSPSGPADIYS